MNDTFGDKACRPLSTKGKDTDVFQFPGLSLQAGKFHVIFKVKLDYMRKVIKMPNKENQNGFNQNESDDFWGKQNDDWNRNVFDTAKEDPLIYEQRYREPVYREPDPQFDGNTDQQQSNAASQYKSADQQQAGAGDHRGEDQRNQPYNSGYVYNNGNGWQYQGPKVKSQGEERREHPRRVITIFFGAAALLFIILALMSGKIGSIIYEKPGNPQIPEETLITGNQFELYGDATLTVGEQAYTLLEAGTKKGLPSGEKLVAVYAETASTSYNGRSQAIRNVYAGHGEEYRRDQWGTDLLPAILDLGFVKNDFIADVYEIDNKYTGYFFFLVPEEWDQMTFYVEQRVDGNSNLGLEKVFGKEMNIVSLTEEEIMDLLSKEER